MEIVTAILPTIIDYSVGPIKKHMSYAFGFRGKVNALRGEVNKLEAGLDSLQSDIEDAQRRGDEVKTIVTDWKTRAEQAIKEAETLIGSRYEEAKRACSLALCLNLKTRYRIGKNAEDGLRGINQLLEEKDKFGQISRRPNLQQLVRPPVEGYEAQSRAKILKEVMDAIQDPNIIMAGVYGMGGIGKTTFAKEVHQLATQNKLFDKVVMTRVTVEPNLTLIQDEIAEFVIGSKLEETSDSARASSLYQKLKDKQVLIILDDLWSKLDLVEGVGIPTGADSKGCKILLTSRNLHVLSEMRSQKNFGSHLLSNEESMSLFEKEVIEIKNQEIAKKIVDKCAGFPLMIVTVAGLLRDKDVHGWNTIMTQLSKSDDQIVEKKVYSILELSYNHLPDEKTKQIFLLCSMCGRSDAALQNLLRYSLGLDLFKRYTISEAKDQLKILIDQLKACSLVDVDEFNNVNMHDTVRDVAITIACRDERAFKVEDGKVLNEWPNKDDLIGCTKVSIPYNHIKQLPEDLGCSELEFMLLFCGYNNGLHIPDSTFQYSKQLKMMHLTFIGNESMPRSLCFLTNLRTLCLEHCNLSSTVAGIGYLKNLEILSFYGSSLKALPFEIGQLTKLKLLDLSYCYQLCYIPTNTISKLTSLEELLMKDSFDEWEIEEHGGGSNASLLELKCLCRLASLEIRVPNVKALPKVFSFNCLETYQILIGEDWYFYEDSKTTKILRLDLGTSGDVLQQVRELLKELETLDLKGIEEFTNLLNDNEGFPKLKELCIENSPEVQSIVDCRMRGIITCFPLLESLELHGLQNLVSIFHGQLASDSFRKIKKLKISVCQKLKSLFSVSMVQGLSQLEEIRVWYCSGMEALFVEESSCSYEVYEVVEFPRLRRLELRCLPQLKCFLCARESLSGLGRSSEMTTAEKLMPFSDEKVAFPCLEHLSLHSIGNIQMIWCTQLDASAFPKLISLDISYCDELREIFRSDIFRNFQNLKDLDLSNCSLLEEIHQFRDDIAEELNNEPMIFGLNALRLRQLPRSKCIRRKSSTQEYFKFDKLESIRVSFCEGLENLFPPVIAENLSQLKDLQVSDCSKLEEIIAQEECWENLPCILFPQLESLILEDLPQLRSFRHTFSWPNLKSLKMRRCDKARIFGSLNEVEAFEIVSQPHLPNQPQPFVSLERVAPKLEKLSIDGMTYKSLSGSWFKYLTRLESLELYFLQGKLIAVSELEIIPNLRVLKVQDSHIRELWTGFNQTDNVSMSFAQPSLRELVLSDVKGLGHVWRRGSQMDPLLPYLEVLQLEFCGNLISFAASTSASFQNLSSLFLSECPRMTEFVKISTAKTMGNLVTLTIEKCHALKEVVAAEEQQQEGDALAAPPHHECIRFNKLKTLQLSYLGSLEGFCMSNCHSFNFPCLEEVSVQGCHSMRIFCNGDLITPKLGRKINRGMWGGI